MPGRSNGRAGLIVRDKGLWHQGEICKRNDDNGLPGEIHYKAFCLLRALVAFVGTFAYPVVR